MKSTFKISTLFFTLLLFSCNNNESKETQELKNLDKVKIKILENTGVSISNFTVVNKETSQANDDYSLTYTIKLDSLDFPEILDQIKKTPYYTGEFNPGVPPKSVMKSDQIKRWAKVRFGYRFEYFIDGTDKFLQYEVDTSDCTLTYTYIEE